MGHRRNDLFLVEGMTLFDVDTKSIGILIRRLSTKEYPSYLYAKNLAPPYDHWHLDAYVTYVWDSIWSKDGRVVYSEGGLKNLIKAGIIKILDNGVIIDD